MDARPHHFPGLATMKNLVRIGTRGSDLALAQTGLVVDALRKANSGIRFEPVVIKTKGDRDQRSSPARIGYGVFVKELENALLAGEVDIAVHSMKDMLSTLDPQFAIAAVPYREDPRDVLVSRHGEKLMDLPKGAHVGTGSSRRRALLLDKRPDLRVEPVRGNVPTRLAKLEAPDGPDALVLAAAGLKRLGLESKITEYLACWDFVSAVGQGALAVEVRADDKATAALAAPLDNPGTHAEVDAERAFLARVRGGCSAPVSAHARIREGKVSMHAFAADPNGTTMLRADGKRDAREAIALAEDLADELLRLGARKLMAATGAADDD
jgi:hydroxymethylbilane synthase